MLRSLHCLLLVLCVAPLGWPARSPCPSGCCCPHPGVLVLCESLGLQSLPRSVPLNTSVLSVARNRLCNVDNLLQPFSGLQELSLSHNQLARFPRGLPPSLESLQLQENRITYITAGVLRQLGNLTRLDLEDNRIRAIQPGALLGLARLRMLTLKGNRLSSLPLNLPSSLTHLDLSANCISALDLPSMAALINLQVLKINSNCLHSVPESAFDGLPRLRSVELANNLWVCECDIMYLYRWLLTGRMRMATDLVCAAPRHLAHRLLLTLSVMAICPRVLKPNEKVPPVNFTAASEGVLPSPAVQRAAWVAGAGTPSPLNMTRASRRSHRGSRQTSERKFSAAENHTQAAPTQHGLSRPRYYTTEYYTLEGLSYEECLALNSTQARPTSTETPSSAAPSQEPWCLENSSAVMHTSPLGPTREAGVQPESTPRVLFLPGASALVAVLAVLCVLAGLLMLAVLLVLKKILERNQRVAPLQS